MNVTRENHNRLYKLNDASYNHVPSLGDMVSYRSSRSVGLVVSLYEGDAYVMWSLEPDMAARAGADLAYDIDEEIMKDLQAVMSQLITYEGPDMINVKSDTNTAPGDAWSGTFTMAR